MISLVQLLFETEVPILEFCPLETLTVHRFRIRYLILYSRI